MPHLHCVLLPADGFFCVVALLNCKCIESTCTHDFEGVSMFSVLCTCMHALVRQQMQVLVTLCPVHAVQLCGMRFG